MDTFDLKKYIADNPLLKEEILTEENITQDITDELKKGLVALKSQVKNMKPSPKDEEVNEIGGIGIASLVVGAPGLIKLLGNVANGVTDILKKGTDSAVFDKETYKKGGGKNLTQTTVGKGLVKAGTALEEMYLDLIADALQATYPSKFKGQDPHDEGSALYKAAHKVYAGLLIAGAIGAGFEAVNAHNAIVAGFEGGTATLKGKEVIDIAKAIA
jgi:hypothetical protein